MTKTKLYIKQSQIQADIHTPVSIYLSLRDKFGGSLLLESSDYHGNENSFSMICCQPIAKFMVDNNIITEELPNGIKNTKSITENNVPDALQSFINLFDLSEAGNLKNADSLFGYTSYEALKYFDNIELHDFGKSKKIPEILYVLYRYVLVLDHFNDTLNMYEFTTDETHQSTLDKITAILTNRGIEQYPFSLKNEITSNLTDDEYKALVNKGKQHCQRGDVFQIVISREYSIGYIGDDFNVYRALRSVNPSPYLFYFDEGNFKIFGSSPEAQLVIENNTAAIHPIAGTFRRTGNDADDAELAKKLLLDTKENAEHVMLVDLARNDLSRACKNVIIEKYKEVQFFSHVIHLVSKVTGELKSDSTNTRIAADTFPAGTLTGAPKHKAMQLISKLENNERSYYGGCIGFYGLKGGFNHAIIIRSFLAKENKLHWRAGAGVVADSTDVSELQEVNNKLAALRKALEKASENISQKNYV